jgi:hypothetical protein
MSKLLLIIGGYVIGTVIVTIMVILFKIGVSIILIMSIIGYLIYQLMQIQKIKTKAI